MAPQDGYWNYGQQPASAQAGQQTTQLGQIAGQTRAGQLSGAWEAPAEAAMRQQVQAQGAATAAPVRQAAMPSTSQPGLAAGVPNAEPAQAAQALPQAARQFNPPPQTGVAGFQAQPQSRLQADGVRQNAAAVQANAPYGSEARSRSASAQGAGPLPPPSQGAPAAAGTFQAAPVQQAKGHGWIVAIVAIVCLAALMAFGVKSCSDSMASITQFGSAGGSGLENLDGDAIAVLELDGTIQYDGSACSPEGFKKLLDQAAADSHVKALVLRVNSGGGTATAGEEMAEYLKQFDKPVVVSSASINASAAYEISSQADYIFVAKSTEIGAIGTVMQLTDLSGLFEKLGIRMDTIASADSKDSSYGYRALTDDERTYYQHMIDQINDLFVQNVAEGRHMKEADVRKLATGLVFTGVDAVSNGLADGIGTREDAVKKAAELAGTTDYTTTDLSFETYDLGSLSYLFGEDRSSAEDVVALLERLGKDGSVN